MTVPERDDEAIEQNERFLGGMALGAVFVATILAYACGAVAIGIVLWLVVSRVILP